MTCIGREDGCNCDTCVARNEVEKLRASITSVRVTHAAIRHGDLVHVVRPPKRHHHIIHALAELGCETPIRGEQGFLLSDGTFATRRKAETVARAAGQLVGAMKGSILTSEDLW